MTTAPNSDDRPTGTSTKTSSRRANSSRSVRVRIVRSDGAGRSADTNHEQGRLFSLALHRLAAGENFVTPRGNRSLSYLLSKRAIDVVGASCAILLFLPLLTTVFVMLLFTTRGRPLFFQQRVGHCGRLFQMVKFRTMRLDAERFQYLIENDKDGPIFKNRCDPRITRIGRILRKSSIDEMPQLFNVLLGHMSLVGPRPPVASEVAEYKPWQRERLSVMPGLTCLWQVSGRSDIDFEHWVRLDIWYVRNQCLWTDLKLLALTPWTVISCRGAY